VGISIYLRESLKSPKWLIPEVAQPQVPFKKIRNILCAFLCVPSHKANQKQEKNKARVMMVIVEGVWWYGGMIVRVL
jgi:hypothetical protein